MTAPMPDYSNWGVIRKQDIAKILDIPPRKVAHLFEIGAIHPAQGSRGPSNMRTYPFPELLRAAVVIELERLGVRSQQAKEFAQQDSVTEAIEEGNHVEYVDLSPREYLSLPGYKESFVVLNLNRIFSRVRDATQRHFNKYG